MGMPHYVYVYTTERFLARKKDVSGVRMEDYRFAVVSPGDFWVRLGIDIYLALCWR